MSRVPDIFARSVGFLLFKSKGREELSFAGTCFLVQYPLSTPGRAMQYLVTAAHVIAYISQNSVDGTVYVRVNRVSGEIAHVRSHPSDWIRHPTDPFIDVAVCQWQPHDFDDVRSPESAKAAPMDLIPVGTDLFASPSILRDRDVGIGDDVFAIGLFSRFVGSAKNMPIVRKGSVALMPDEPVPTRKFGNIEAYLIELRSIGGLSGSPVFLYHVGSRVVRGQIDGAGLFYFLGLVHGHWDTPKSRKTGVRRSNRKVVSPFEAEKVNLGIAVVIPAQKIVEVLDHPGLKKIRTEIETTGSSKVQPGVIVSAVTQG